MNERALAMARRRAELAARIELQRLSLQIQTRLLVTSRPWPRAGWRRQAAVLVGGVALVGASAWFARGRIAQATGTGWRVARLAARIWVMGKLGWQLVGRTRRPGDSAASAPARAQ